MKTWKRMFVLACLMVGLYSVSANALMIHGEGLNLNDTVTVSDEIEFVGISGYIGFDFQEFEDHILLTLLNVEKTKGLIWLNYGTYTFDGFNTITGMSIYDNQGYHGKIISNYKWDEHSISLDFSIGYFEVSSLKNQKLTFWIDTESIPLVLSPPTVEDETSPVPEPSAFLLFGVGSLMLFRKRK